MTGPRRAIEEDLRDPETGQWNMDEVKHRSKGWIAVLIALAVVAGGTWFVGSRALQAINGVINPGADYPGPGVTEVQVTIPNGSSMTKVGSILEEADVVKSAEAFRRVAGTYPEEASKVQAGTYRMKTQMSAEQAFRVLTDPANVVRRGLTLPEGQTMAQQFGVMSKAVELPVSEFEAAAKDKKALGLPSWAKNSAEGFFFPDTYDVPDDPTAVGILKMTVNRFKDVTEAIGFEDKAKASPAGDPYTALVMASLVEREAPRQEDRQKVARVFYNRVAQKMPLQSDATVNYAVGKTGEVWTTPEERQTDSPYNTYLPKNAGKLPPGPISAPSRAAMEAAVSPAEGDWLYFVPINLNTGETVFSNTLEEHNAAVARLQAWCKDPAQDTENRC